MKTKSRNYSSKVCTDCKIEFIPRGGRQWRCSPCGKEKRETRGLVENLSESTRLRNNENKKVIRLTNTEEVREYNRKWYAANSKRIMPDKTAAKKKTQAKIRSLINSAKDVPCTDCGIKYDSEVMDLDHVRGKKLFDVSLGYGRVMAMNKILEEIKKCEVVCSNCHRIRTRDRRLSKK